MAALRFRDAAELWPLVDRAFQRHSREIRSLVPSAKVDHVGATAVMEGLTKGDLDLLVRVPAGEVDAAAKALRRRYAQGEGGVSFRDLGDPELPVEIRLAAEGSPQAARVLELRRVLRSRPDLVAEANELKRRFERGDPEAYEAAKQSFYGSFL